MKLAQFREIRKAGILSIELVNDLIIEELFHYYSVPEFQQ